MASRDCGTKAMENQLIWMKTSSSQLLSLTCDLQADATEAVRDPLICLQIPLPFSCSPAPSALWFPVASICVSFVNPLCCLQRLPGNPCQRLWGVEGDPLTYDWQVQSANLCLLAAWKSRTPGVPLCRTLLHTVTLLGFALFHVTRLKTIQGNTS